MPPRVAPMDPTSDPSSPYYVHSSDGPSSVKVTPLLTGSSYHSWSRSMRHALGGKLKLEFVDGTIPIPEDQFDPSFCAWNRCNMLVHSWIMNSSQILLMDPLPPMTKVVSLVLQHERQSHFSTSDDSRVLLNAAKSRGSSSSRSGNRVCTFCGKDNHIVDNCFKKHGLPPHFRKNSQVNNAAIEGGIEDHNASEVTNAELQSGPPITQDQALQLISLLQNSFPSQGAKLHLLISLGNWIVDSGASHHMCSSIQWFHSYSGIVPINVKLPNGNIVLAKYSGIVKFPSGLVINNVLCVPHFSVNLISVSQLCKMPTYIVNFTDSKCLIQDQLTKNMIGSASVTDGLYYLDLTSQDVHAYTADGTQQTNIPDQAL
ncbi:unnamed protein product [Trifolium pratense]|uniref:Uncharacterized protein n=1 Tax=Trifolium pratense TaxID=57577 RepID=A0ACB0KP78_TRIPR|nr:unnamed protein product [Trifolium pratense]